MRDIIVGIDAGTSVIKSIAFDLQGSQLQAASVKNEYQLIEGGGAEQNLNLTWSKTCETLRKLAALVPDLKNRVAAIAVTGQGDGTWLIGAHGEPVADGLLWLDARAAETANEITQSSGNRRRFELTGTGVNACQQGPQLRWLQQNNPQAFSAAKYSLHCKDWLYYNLTGDIATDPSEGVFSFGDYRTRQYSEEVLNVLGLTEHRSLLPEMIDGTETRGALSTSAANACELLEGTPVVLAYVDVVCTALGSGLYASSGDRGCSIVGSTGMHMRLARSVEDIDLNDACTGYTMCMPVPGVYAQMQSNMSATLNIDWLLDLLGGLLDDLGVKRSRAELLSSLDGWVATAAPASLLYQPYISEAGERGPFIDTNARAGFTGLCTRHGIADITRAIFEGLALASRDCYLAMGSLPGEVCLSGGAARSRQLLNIIAATLESSVQTSTRDEAGAAGAAMMAAVSIGHYASMDECITEWVEPLMGELITPDAELVSAYQSIYPSYAEAHHALQPVWKALAEHRNGCGNSVD